MRFPRALAAVLTLLGTAAFAQVNPLVPLQITANGGLSTYTFGANQCAGMLTATWTSTLTGVPCGIGLQFWITQGECGDAAVTGDVPLDLDTVPASVVFSLHTGTFSVDVSALPFPGNSSTAAYDGGVSCGAANATVNMKLCGAISLQSGISCIVNHASPLAITYDTQPPVAPAIESVVVKDAALTATVSFSSDTEFVYLQAKGGSDTDFGHDTQIVVLNSSTGTVNGLQDGNTYDLRAYAVDAAGNVSDYSPTVSATPLHATGFWEAYRRAGGQAQGCAALGAPPLLIGALMLLLRRRKR